ncbi:M24 family metallopeptidase [Falsiroseomonas sp. E2-1-a20]|uniref:M24 family metallopeptidase n=1 Tax=Falsiroseomonas sp. E2-1-a20 TaxID=3239300 RepID=UPI003F2E505F
MTSRIATFRQKLEGRADLAFIPLGTTDLHYLAGLARDIPKYGVTMHPGDWLEGAWVTPGHAPVLALPRMTAEFGGRGAPEGVELRVLGDWDDPAKLVSDLLAGFRLPARPRIAISERAQADSLVHLQALLPDAVFVSATAILREQRLIKAPEEIALMREAGRRTEAAFAALLPKLRFGMTELDAIAELDWQMKRQDSLGPTFTTTLYNTGPNNPLMLGRRMESWKRRIEPPVSVLFDFGASHEGLCYDYGRTVSFGEPSAEQVRVHGLVMQAQRTGIAALKVGATCESVDAVARQVILDAGLGAGFRHRLGHGIGWDVHEPPFLTRGDATVLREGMMFTIEPSILQDTGFSARTEDVVVVRDAGGERLTEGFQELLVVDH